MAKRERYFSVDVEASGPIPGPWWMPSIGVCPTDDVQDGFKAMLKPLDHCYKLTVHNITQPDVPGAMRVVAMGTPNFEWLDGVSDEDNCKALYDYYVVNGEHPKDAFQRLKSYFENRTNAGESRPWLVGSPLSFDFMWTYWYYQFVMGEMPRFGFSGLDLRTYYMGMHGETGLRTNKRRMKGMYPTNLPHDHDPLHDAQEQAEIWQQMVTDRKYKYLGDPPGTS